MTITVKGKDIGIDDDLVEKYTAMFSKIMDEQEVRCHMAAAFDKPVDDILSEKSIHEIESAIASLISSEISMFKKSSRSLPPQQILVRKQSRL